MAQQLKEVEAIANNKAKPTFDNTIIALEKSGDILDRATTVFFSLVGADTNDTRKKLQADYSAKFAAHSDAIALNGKLFARIQALYDTRSQLGLDAEGVRLVEKYYDNYVRAGAKLSEADKATLKEMNAELANLGTKFSQNVQSEVNASAITVDDVKELAGLSKEQIAAAAEAAKARGLEGKYVITLLNTTGQPPLTNLANRALRQKIYEASVSRGSRGGEFDNTALVSRIMQLRADKAKLMGFANFAAYNLTNQTAKTPEAVNAMLGKLAPAAVANAKREAADLQAMIDQEQKAAGKKTFQLEPWDWAFYSEKVRQAKYNFDESQLKPYFEMKNVLENGVFYAAGQEFGLTFKQRTDLPVYHDDVTVYDVFDADGSQLAIFIFDPYARASKRGGAWMNSYVSQSKLTGFKPVVANHLRWCEDHWELESPYQSEGCRRGTCKCPCAAQARANEAPHVLMIGDGSSDFCVSEDADFVFAKRRLITHCTHAGIEHAAIDTFHDAIALLPRLLDGSLLQPRRIDASPQPTALPLLLATA
ncbi:hypothetical protein G6F57_014203 [Rhizopus arrhizus]|nr:hypothetical protein G6F57_014203 [Rhizopus arrhizus]